jgi:hypothetical protein
MTASREGQLEGYAQLRQAKTTTIIGLGKRLSKYFSNVWEQGRSYNAPVPFGKNSMQK